MNKGTKDWILNVEINAMESLNTIVDNCMFPILRKWQLSHINYNETNENEQISQCLLQLMISKGKTLQLISNGFSISNQYSGIIDISSMASIMRSIYETAFIYHNIFIDTENEIEQKILLYLWKLRGYNNLTQPVIPIELTGEKTDAEKKISELKDIIANLIDYIDITDKAIGEINYAINKGTTKIGGYIFKKDSRHTIVNLQKVSMDKSEYFFNDNRYASLYNYLSIHSHPTYLGLLQFGQIYDGISVYEHSDSLLLMACICLTKFTFDFCKTVEGGESIWNEYESNNFTVQFFSQM